jgi:hypothetical protein
MSEQQACDAWNAKYPLGVPLAARNRHGVARDLNTQARSRAYLDSCGIPVVRLDNQRGEVPIDNLEPRYRSSE